jgi:hypothetical protein
MPAAKVAAFILKQLRSGRRVGDAGTFGRYQDFGICPKRAHRSKTPRRPEASPQCGTDNKGSDCRSVTSCRLPSRKMRSPILRRQRSETDTIGGGGAL